MTTGFVFSREFLVSKGAQPAIYLNSYGDNSELKDAADRIYTIGAKKGFNNALSSLIPYLNAMDGRYDFAWEREWRVVGKLAFEPADIVCVILPEQGEEKLKDKLLEGGVPVISPGWTAERIVDEFSKQARKARRVWKGTSGSKGRRKRPRC